MRIILCDTNKIFRLFIHFIRWNLTRSWLRDICVSKKYDVYISAYILDELAENIYEKEQYAVNHEDIESFLRYMNIQICPSTPLMWKIMYYVSDFDDAQILQDAIWLWADILLTNNLKDFNRVKIKVAFGIDVIDRIE